MKQEIDLKELKRLQAAEEKLAALENNGVDNWPGYDIAMKEIRAREQEAEHLEGMFSDLVDEICQNASYDPGLGVSAEWDEGVGDQIFSILKTGVDEFLKKFKYTKP